MMDEVYFWDLIWIFTKAIKIFEEENFREMAK